MTRRELERRLAAAIRQVAARRCGLRRYPAARIALREWPDAHWQDGGGVPPALVEAAAREAAADPAPGGTP